MNDTPLLTLGFLSVEFVQSFLKILSIVFVFLLIKSWRELTKEKKILRSLKDISLLTENKEIEILNK